MTSNSVLDEWAKQILANWLGRGYQLSKDKIEEKNWLVVPCPDIINPMQAEWLADAICSLGNERLVGVAFEYGGKPDVEQLKATRDSLLRYSRENSHRYVIFTNCYESFLYFEDEANRYFLLCGDEQFISQAYRCTFDTAKMMYFEHWVEWVCNEAEQRFMTSVWNRYLDDSWT